MGKVKGAATGLRGYFTRSLLLAVFGAVAIVTAYWWLLNAGIQFGYILPANAGEKAANPVIQELRENGTASGISDTEAYQYVHFDAEGNIVSASLTGSALDKMAAVYSDPDASAGNVVAVWLEDGSCWLFSWRYTAVFTNPGIRRIFPSVDVTLIIILLASLVLYLLAYVRHISRKLSTRLDVLTAASRQIAARDLDQAIPVSSGLREFDHVLASMEDMRQALKASLFAQWQAEQQRREEVAALAHDIKTPLTIAGGNAELLLEDQLTGEQRECAESIDRAVKRAREYITLLQQVSAMEAVQEEPQEVTVDSVLSEVNMALAPLAAGKHIMLAVSNEVSSASITVYRSMLVRALLNIGENAIRYTPENGTVNMDAAGETDQIMFIITDGGRGFSSEALKHAKEMLWQDDKSRTGKDNYGMGLAIAAKAAEAHGGRLIIENCETGGRVRLQIKDQDSLSAACR